MQCWYHLKCFEIKSEKQTAKKKEQGIIGRTVNKRDLWRQDGGGVGGLEGGSPRRFLGNTPSDVEDLTGQQLRAGKRPRAPERNVQIHAKPGRVQEGGRRRRLSRTRPAPETAGGAGGTEAGVRSPVRKTVQDRGLASEAPGERSSTSVTS